MISSAGGENNTIGRSIHFATDRCTRFYIVGKLDAAYCGRTNTKRFCCVLETSLSKRWLISCDIVKRTAARDQFQYFVEPHAERYLEMRQSESSGGER
jgi:hypothetical protein